MGIQQSKQLNEQYYNEKEDWVTLQEEHVATSLSQLSLDGGKPMSADGTLTTSELKKWEFQANRVCAHDLWCTD